MPDSNDERAIDVTLTADELIAQLRAGARTALGGDEQLEEIVAGHILGDGRSETSATDAVNDVVKLARLRAVGNGDDRSSV